MEGGPGARASDWLIRHGGEPPRRRPSCRPPTAERRGAPWPFNTAVFSRLAVRDGKIVEYDLRPPFDILFGMPRFEYGSLVEVTPPHTNTQVTVAGPVMYLGRRRPPAPTCRDEVLAAIGRLVERTGKEIFTVAAVFTEMVAHGTRYKESAVYKTMQRMKDPSAVAGPATLGRVGRRGFRLLTPV